MGVYYDHKRRIKENQVYNIHPSQGFLGIEEGVVRIEKFVDFKSVPKDAPDRDLGVDFPEYGKMFWVKYRYLEQKKESYGMDWYLPGELFAEHISTK